MTREQMLARQNEILQAARAESRAMTAEERAEFDTLQRSIEALDRAGATAGGEGSSRGAAVLIETLWNVKLAKRAVWK